MTKTYTATQKRDRLRMPQERERDLVQIAAWYLRGWTHMEIATRLSEDREYTISRATVGNDIREIHKRWLQSQLIDFNAAQARELARLDELANEYWEAWERSRQDAEEVIEENVLDEQSSEGAPEDGATGRHSQYKREKRRVKTHGRDGDVRFLEGVERCIEKRCTILGLNAAARSVVDINWRKTAQEKGLESVANEQFEQLVSRFSAALATDGTDEPD